MISETLRSRFLAHVGQTSPSPMMIEVERAQGVWLYGPQGNRWLDLVSGVSVSNVGHANRAVVDAVKHQADSYMHTMVYGDTVQRVQVEYAELLCGILPSGIDSIYFVNSGTESIEGAMKLAKRATSRSEIISMVGAYHGSTQGALSIQGAEDYKTAFRPLLPDTRRIRFNNFEDLQLITSRTAAVVMEVVQGEAGVRLPSGGYLEALAARCQEVGALVVLDEVQTGFGRTGSVFGAIKYDFTPDIVCMGKALGGGMPLGAFAARTDLTRLLTHDPVLGHINTFGGNPVCCAAGMAATSYILEHNLCENAEAMGALFERELIEHSAVVEVRRSGLLMAVELGSSQRMFRVVELLTQAGLMTDWFLFCDTAFRISPPLSISQAEVQWAVKAIRAVLDQAL